MKHEKFGIFSLLLVAAALLTALAFTIEAIAENKAQPSPRTPAQDRDLTRERLSDQDRDASPIYGSMLMTEREMQEHRATMRALKTEQERQAYRSLHHQRMQERARSQGITLPELPPGVAQ